MAIVLSLQIPAYKPIDTDSQRNTKTVPDKFGGGGAFGTGTSLFDLDSHDCLSYSLLRDLLEYLSNGDLDLLEYLSIGDLDLLEYL